MNKDKIKEYQKEYRKRNKDKIKEYQKEYRKRNKDKIKEYDKKCRNKEYQKEYQKEYRKRNKDKIKEYYEENKDKIKEFRKEYYEENKDKIKEYYREYSKKYYQENKDKYGKTDTLKIYKLIYNRDVIYVGLTKLTLNRRKGSANYSVPKEIYKLSKIELIEETNDKGRERFWIEHYLKLGAPLMNKRNGDFSNKKQALEYRKNRHKQNTK